MKNFDNVEFKKVDITNINAKDDSFDVAYEVVRGRMSCDIAIIDVKKSL